MPRNYSSLDRDFGARFLQTRKDRGLSQEAVTAALAIRGIPVHVTAIGKIERGERRVSIGEASALASIFGMSVDELINGETLRSLRMEHDFARQNLVAAAQAFTWSLTNLAIAADKQGDKLGEHEADNVRDAIELETPAMVIRVENMEYEVETAFTDAEPTRPERGPFVALLEKCIARDDEALRTASLDAIMRK